MTRAVAFVLAVLVSLAYGAFVSALIFEKDERKHRDEDHARQLAENDKCALRGLVLLRGQLGEFVCVVTGSERGRRTP